MKQVDLYGRVRHSVLIEGISQREAARIFGIDPRTVAKMLSVFCSTWISAPTTRESPEAGCVYGDYRSDPWRQISWFQRSSGIRQSASLSGCAMSITLLAASRS